MPKIQPQLLYPILLAGIRPGLKTLLQQCGIPVADYASAICYQGTAVLGKRSVVLYHSQIPVSRHEARAASTNGCTTIDVSSLVSKPDSNESELRIPINSKNNPETAELIHRLKTSVEAHNGLWVRIGDYPFPYQGVQFVEDDTRLASVNRFLSIMKNSTQGSSQELSVALEPQFADSLSQESSSQIYSRGLPMFSSALEQRDTEYPLLWKTSLQEFQQWWELRNQMSLQVSRDNSQYIIESTQKQGGFQPKLEIWRDEHVASLPLFAGKTFVREEGLVFQHDPKKHPGGIAANSLALNELYHSAFSHKASA
jgi:hypothetical protein